jgi:hypothetical protein
VSNDPKVINNVVYEKYSKLFSSNNLPLRMIGTMKVLTYTMLMVSDILKKLSQKKATSWYLIPGKSYEVIMQQPKSIADLASFINEMLKLEEIPAEIGLGRLFCLNKNCGEPVKENTIRSLVIMGMIIKIIECPLNLTLKSVALNKAQLGFREKLSIELNILRLR